MCFHCRQMVHIWKEIAKEFNGVINIGAVNCKVDPELCRQENIPAYPFLRLYPSVSQTFQPTQIVTLHHSLLIAVSVSVGAI